MNLTMESRYFLEPIPEVWIHAQEIRLVKRRSMMRIMARRTKAATVEETRGFVAVNARATE